MFEIICALNKEIIEKKDMISLSQTIEYKEDNVNYEGILTLTIGRGYFSGSILKFESFDKDDKDDKGANLINRMIDRSIEINAKLFINYQPPGKDDPWVL
jgi:hypothetical protein